MYCERVYLLCNEILKCVPETYADADSLKGCIKDIKAAAKYSPIEDQKKLLSATSFIVGQCLGEPFEPWHFKIQELLTSKPKLEDSYYTGDYDSKDNGFLRSNLYINDTASFLSDNFINSWDPVSNPDHYTKGKIQPKDFIQDQKMNYNEGCVIKYITRYKHKGTPVEDLQKAKQYIDFILDTYTKGENK